MIHQLLVICLIFFSFTAANAGDGWKFEFEKEGISIYTRNSPSSDFKEFKGEMTIQANIADIAQMISDVERYPDWCYKTTKVTIIEKDSTTTRYFYISNTPSFLKTRVACFASTREFNPQTGEIQFSLKDIKCDEPISEDMLLIPIMKGYWKLTPIEGGKVIVFMQMLTEPGGIIPAWLANLIVVDSPFTTLKNLSLKIKGLEKRK